MATATTTTTTTSKTTNDEYEQASERITHALTHCGVAAIRQMPAFLQSVRLAQGIRALQKAVTPEFVTNVLMPLSGTQLGFVTDKDKDGGYPPEVVRSCAIEALLRGFQLVGNEFNIIGGKFYAAKNGLERQVLAFPGFRNLVMTAGVPVSKDGGALVPYSASWQVGNEPMSIHCQLTRGEQGESDTRIPVKVNAGMGADAILGKAERKMFMRIWKRLNGGALGLVDGEAEDMGPTVMATGEEAPPPVVPAGTREGHRVKMGNGKGKAAEGKPQPRDEAKDAPAKSEPIPIRPNVAKPANGNSGALPSWPEIQAALTLADKGWEGDDRLPTIMAWSDEQRRSAYAWALAFTDNDRDDHELPPRPPHTVLARQPGED